jgi:hypothetical protein
MKDQSVHEPKAKVMSAAEVWDDAQEVAKVLRRNLLKAEPVIRLPVPFSVLLSAVDDFDQDELLLLRRRIDERLAA